MPNSCSRYDSEMCWRWLIPASVTGPCSWRRARSIIAVTAKRPFVVSLMMVGEPQFSTIFVKYKYMTSLVKYPCRHSGY
ncbi:hypothetical protein PSP6_520014 [Paraburkholderia tropica]|nr:hypothetical protein PSP6_520014 [Paraburkholderia tropica]